MLKTKREKRLQIMSANLRYLRESRFPGRGGSKKCADALGMKQQQWSPWEKGQRMPTDDSLRRIAAYFGVTVDYLKTDHQGSHAAHDIQGGSVAVPPPAVPKQSNKMVESDPVPHTADIVREITDDIRSQILARLLNIKATLKLELTVVDVDLRM